MTTQRTDAFSLVGIGAAACVGCCAVPILALLGGVGVAGVASTALLGTAGLAITATAMVALIAVRRRNTTCDTAHEPTPIAAPPTPTHTHATGDPPMQSIPIYDATAPIACTASADEIPKRIEQVERMRSHLAAVERTNDGLLLHFPNRPDIDDELRRFTLDEKACCRFWGFAIDSDPDQLHLRWDAPPTLTDYMNRLLDFFQGDQPLTADAGLL